MTEPSTGPLTDGASEGDLVDDARPADAVSAGELPLEAPEADALEQSLAVPADEEEYRG